MPVHEGTCPVSRLYGQVTTSVSVSLPSGVDALVGDVPQPTKNFKSEQLGGYDLAMPSATFHAERPLTSWKEIAHFFNKSVRTVQRWEQLFGLPVRRPDAHDHGIVVAFPHELAGWMQSHLTVCRANGNGRIRNTTAAPADQTSIRSPQSIVDTRRIELLSALREERAELRRHSRALLETMSVVKSNWSRLHRNRFA